jgi:hypothetical protein
MCDDGYGREHFSRGSMSHGSGTVVLCHGWVLHVPCVTEVSPVVWCGVVGMWSIVVPHR